MCAVYKWNGKRKQTREKKDLVDQVFFIRVFGISSSFSRKHTIIGIANKNGYTKWREPLTQWKRRRDNNNNKEHLTIHEIE